MSENVLNIVLIPTAVVGGRFVRRQLRLSMSQFRNIPLKLSRKTDVSLRLGKKATAETRVPRRF